MTRIAGSHWTDRYTTTACKEGVAEASQYANAAAWWHATERGDWMLWLAARDPRISQGSEAHRRLCWAVCLIWWELAYPYWYDHAEKTGDHRPEQIMDAFESWLRDGKLDETIRLSEAAWVAEAAQATWATWAARAAWAAQATWAAEAAGVTEAAGAAGAAQAASLKRIAEIVREECLEPTQ